LHILGERQQEVQRSGRIIWTLGATDDNRRLGE
jgi:hypothetical protein